MKIPERPVDSPTMARLKLRASVKGDRPYAYFLFDHDLVALQRAGLPLTTAVAYACIKGAARAARSTEWVTLRPRTVAAVGRDSRWWHRRTAQLEAAGMLEVERHRGRLPRYRLRPSLELL